MRHIIKEHLSNWPNVAKEADEAIDTMFKPHMKALEDALEETCEVNSPITFAYHHGGIDTKYWFSSCYGTVEVYLGDDPDDYHVKILKQQLKLVDI